MLAGEERLGRKPEELAGVVTELALGAPGILAARSWAATGCSEAIDRAVRQRGAAMVAEGFRTLLHQPTAMGVVRREALAYGRATLRYAVAGCLQAVLDEHFHQVWGQLAWKDEALDDKAVAERMAEAASIKTSRVRANTLRARRRSMHLGTMRLRTSFALRYGKVVGDKDTAIDREGAVREAFNSVQAGGTGERQTASA